MMSTKILCLFLVSVCATAYPYNGQRFLPQRTIMVNSGYYGHPLARRSYMPEGTMTMFASGADQVATNSFLASQYPVEEEQNVYLAPPEKPDVEETVQEEAAEETPSATPEPAVIQEESSASQEEEEEVTTVKPKKTLRRKQKPKTKVLVDDSQNEEEEEEEGAWPFQFGRGAPSYNAFFPITFAANRNRGRQGFDGEDGYPTGSATAIANAFSTGKGGVASSHATAFGDPALSSLFLRKNLQKKNKNLRNNHE
ncbi:unnamed protein product [Brassicogethes aeneus]|uniref:Uncharacterized protein n=1 Tax=Brassicogethes aeneus TaxID=1431903 RepID=A0A9P0B9V6_BRAAE|nr:unnamed protein product [Brassicogethes aeneus]